MLADVVDSLLGQGFGRVLVVNGHGGNTGPVLEWAAVAPGSVALARALGRAPGRDRGGDRSRLRPRLLVGELPLDAAPGSRDADQRKPPVVWPEDENPQTGREALGDGNFGGLYQRSAEDERRLWDAAVQLIRERLESWS